MVRIKRKNSILSEEAKLLINDREWINTQYNVLGRSISSLASELDTTVYIVRKYMNMFGFQTRTRFEQSNTLYTRQKMSENHADFSGEKNPIYGKPRSDETKCKISKANSNPSSETRKKISISRKKFVGENHPNFGKHWKLSPEIRKQMSISRKGTRKGPNNPMYGKTGELNPFFGKHHTEETKKLLSIANSNPSDERRKRISLGYRRRGKDHYMYGKPARPGTGFGKGSYHIKLDGSVVWLRSSYEVLFTNHLDEIKCIWQYEKPFELGNDVWHPDFYLPEYDLYIEVKGWLTDDARRKMFEFHNKYPYIKLRVLQKKDIDLLIEHKITVEYAGLILKDYLETL